MDICNKNILYAVSNLGLGHAQRSLPIIRQLLYRNNKVSIVAFGAALILLKEELAQQVSCIELIDYPKLQRGYGLKHYLYLVLDLFAVFKIVRQERKFLFNHVKFNQVDFIFCDGRYGFFSKNIPSFLICHQIRVLVPGDYKVLVDTSNGEHLGSPIKVSLANFSLTPAAAAPSSKQTGITMAESVNNIITKDNPTIKEILNTFTAKPYFNSPFSFPLSSIKISGFSFGKFISFGKSKIQHLGVDLQASDKTNIYAVNDGKVVAVFNLPNYGKTLIIDHGLNIFSMYLHLDEFKVSKGEVVRRGQLIGLSGETGYVAGPHLHFSMRVDGKRVDPLEFIKTTEQMNDNSFTASAAGGFFNFFNNK